MAESPILSLAERLSMQTTFALKNAQLVISLSTYEESMNTDGYHRRYLLGTCKDDSEVLFLTTNEVPNDPFSSISLAEHFTVLDGFTSLIEEFNTNSPVRYFEDSIHSPPKYVHYDIELMDDRFKPLFLDHLKKQVDGLAVDYVKKHFTRQDADRLVYWREKLLK